MKYKKGQKLYQCCIDDNCKVSIDEWRVSTINKNGTYAILVTPYTWTNKATKGKRFSKTINMGWASDIPAWCRKYARPGADFYDLHTTPLAAARAEEKGKMSWLDDEEIPKARRNLKAFVTRLKSAKKSSVKGKP